MEISASDAHYDSGAATRFGSDAGNGTNGMGIWYGQTADDYVGFDEHNPTAAGSTPDEMSKCTFCHMGPDYSHSFRPEEIFAAQCASCHTEVSGTNLEEIRKDDAGTAVDYDGDTDLLEPIKDEIESFKDALVAEMAIYGSAFYRDAGTHAGTHDVVYNESQDRWYVDEDDSGDYTSGDTRWRKWDEHFSRALYNLAFLHDEPGYYAHNPKYVLQLLYDTIDNLDEEYGSVTPTGLNGSPNGALGFTRP